MEIIILLQSIHQRMSQHAENSIQSLHIILKKKNRFDASQKVPTGTLAINSLKIMQFTFVYKLDQGKERELCFGENPEIQTWCPSKFLFRSPNRITLRGSTLRAMSHDQT